MVFLSCLAPFFLPIVGPCPYPLQVRQKERQGSFDSMVQSLEKKHGVKKPAKGGVKAGKGKGKRAEEDDPMDDEAFAAMQQAMLQRKR